MHPSAIFNHADEADGRGFIAAHPFATICRNGSSGPVVALVPIVSDGERNLIGHVARASDFYDAALTTPIPVTAIFHGANAYVSASYYPSKQATSKVVPTWNYEALEVRGTLRFQPDANDMSRYIVPLTDRMEQDRSSPWSVSDAPSDYIDTLSRAIVGLDITVEAIRFVRKLSQNKSAEDRAGVVSGLRATNDAMASRIADRMRAEP